MRTISSRVAEHITEEITVKGWVHARRDHGGLIFIDLRDHKGLIQLVIQPEKTDAFKDAEQLRNEFAVSATGLVKERDEQLKNPNIASGSVEIVVDKLEILNRSEPLPIKVHGEGQSGEEQRLKYRYLDLRGDKMQTMLRMRAEMYQIMRKYMEAQEFTEVATPILANSSPEGARDFLVPARLHPEKFYALPQAPQQFKQLLMVGGVHRYYQLAACFRDEDPRADRLYGEFYQLDLEMSFVEDGEEVRSTMEPLIKQLVTEFAGKKLLTDDIPRIPYQESMERFGSDKPDLRFGMELVDVTDVFEKTEFGVFKNASCIKAICVKDGASLSRKQIDAFTETAKQEGAGGLPYIKYRTVDNAIVPDSSIAKFLSEEEHAALIKKFDIQDGDVLFFGADERSKVNKVLGRLRSDFADHFELKDPDTIALAWIVDFPFYEWDDKSNKLDFGHNPFSMPKGGLESLQTEDKLSIMADQYDMVMNGYEICSGGVRNHNPDVLYAVFETLGYDSSYVDERFGAMINAFKYGAPPHAGAAFGVDRMLMELTGESNVREVVAFPKNGSGMDVMMNSPSDVDAAQLKELGL